jgi:predicted transcriptional regulator
MMKRITVKTDTEAGFFARGKVLAQLADKGQRLPNQAILSFEDASDMLRLLTQGRLAVLAAVRELPDSITGVAIRLGRDRSAVKRDVDALERAGILLVDSKVSPGHGRIKHIRPAAARLRLEANV